MINQSDVLKMNGFLLFTPVVGILILGIIWRYSNTASTVDIDITEKK